MKKRKILWVSTFIIIIAVIAVCVFLLCSKAQNQVKEIKNEYGSISSVEYNGKVYTFFDESKYYEFIKEELICEKKDLIYSKSYYTLKSDYNNDFIYSSSFGDHRIYTALSINGYKDIIKGEPTSIIINKLGYENETAQMSDSSSAIEEAVALKSLEDNTDNLQTYNKQDHQGWYYVYVCYDNLPIASCVTGITIVDHYGEYMLLCSATDYTYSGFVIANSEITDLIDNIKAQQNTQ